MGDKGKGVAEHRQSGWMTLGVQLFCAPAKSLECPLCLAEEHQRLVSLQGGGYEVVIFKCGFSAIFRTHIPEWKKQEMLERAKKDGTLERWLRSPLPIRVRSLIDVSIPLILR